MSLLASATFSAPGVPLYGTGGGGNIPANLTVSTLTASNISVGTLSTITSLNISSLLTVSSINVGTLDASYVNGDITTNYVNCDGGAEFNCMNPGDVVTIGPGFGQQGSEVSFDTAGGNWSIRAAGHYQSSAQGILNINASASSNQIDIFTESGTVVALCNVQLLEANTVLGNIISNVDTITASNSFLDVVSISSLSCSNFNGKIALQQGGYADQVPYTSTILFATPYPDDNIVVMLTATNKNINSGGNPNISLSSGFGTNGVSSIGFSVDSRDNGVGYAGSFFWTAFPV